MFYTILLELVYSKQKLEGKRKIFAPRGETQSLLVRVLPTVDACVALSTKL